MDLEELRGWVAEKTGQADAGLRTAVQTGVGAVFDGMEAHTNRNTEIMRQRNAAKDEQDRARNAYEDDFNDKAVDGFFDRIMNTFHPLQPQMPPANGLRQNINSAPVKNDLEPVRIEQSSMGIRG